VGLACSRLFVLEEIKGVFKDLVTTGNQFGLETNESTPKIYIYIYIYIYIFFLRRCDPTRVMASSFLVFSRSHTTTHHSR